MAERIGLLGGTFDPPHVGHLLLAENALTQLHLDSVGFVVAGDPSEYKPSASSARHRCAMTELAVMDNPKLFVSYVDVQRPGQTHTYDTLKELHHRFKLHGDDVELFFIVGADNVEGLNGWHKIDRALDMAKFVVAARGYDPLDIPADLEGRVEVFPSLVSGVSSSAVRAMVRDGCSVRYAVPAPVISYIQDFGLYRVDAATPE